MACGTPSIYSNCSGQLEFAEGRGLPVKVIGETPIDEEMGNFFGASQTEVGNYYSPDFGDLAKVMRDAYQNYDLHKEKALKESKEIIETFTWENAASIAVNHLKELPRKFVPIKLNTSYENMIDISFIEKAKVNISGHNLSKKYRVDFYNHETGQLIWGDTLQLHQFDSNGKPGDQSGGVWTAPNASYYVKWRVEVKDEQGNLIKQHIFNCKDKKVYIHLDSKAIGDTIAWFPYVEKFRKLHGCKIVCSTFHNGWFQSLYPEIEFVNPETQVHNIYAMYKIGWFYGEDGTFDRFKNPIDFLSIPLQKTASDILGLPFQEVKPQINVKPVDNKLNTKYVTLSMQSTCQAKYWNHPTGWQEVVDFLNDQGYEVVLIDKHTSFGVENFMNYAPKNVVDKSSCSLNEAFNHIKNAEFHIGISSGLSWVSWALNTPVLMVSSFSQPHCEFQSNCIRIYNDNPTSGYFNTHKLDPSNWNWCPHKEITSMDDWYEVETITPSQVIDNIKLYLL
jgi:autotransporter strand-loop-strand O-heptosyltransferase